MKKLVLSFVVLAIMLISCSKDDDKKCDSCDLLGKKAQMCDNGDGTFTFSYAGESEKITQEDLDALGLTSKEYIDFVCAAGGAGE